MLRLDANGPDRLAVAGGAGFVIFRPLSQTSLNRGNPMAGNTNHAADTDSNDIAEHVRTWNGFMRFVYWSVGFVGAVLVFLAIFRTHG